MDKDATADPETSARADEVEVDTGTRERSHMTLKIEGGDPNPSDKVEGLDSDVEEVGGMLGSKLKLLETSRLKISEEERAARKATWLEHVGKEARSRAEFQIKLMEECPLLQDDWQHVLRHLEEPKDKATVSRMSLDWWELVKKDRTSFLFQEVLPFLFSTVKVNISTLVSCRQVSKLWKDSVDGHLQDPAVAAKRDLDLRTHHPDLIKSVIPIVCFSGSLLEEPEPEQGPEPQPGPEPQLGELQPLDEEGGQFQPGPGQQPEGEQLQGQQQPHQHHPRCLCRHLQFDYLGECPFITRGVMIEDYPVDPQAIVAFLDRCFHILDLWGAALRKFSISFRLAPLALPGIYEHLCEFLEFTPNLRNLTVAASEFGRCAESEEMRNYQYMTGRQLTYQRVQLEPTQLPELPLLKVLNTYMAPVDLHHALHQRYGSTLEILSIFASTGMAADYVNGSRMPQLKHFCFISRPYSPDEREEGVEARITVDWPVLQEIRYLNDHVGGRSVPGIFANLNGFGGTLRKLMLVLEKAEGPMTKLNSREITSLSLELPLVEELILCVSRVNLSRIDFILPMVSLKELNLYYGKPEKKVGQGGAVKPFPAHSKTGAKAKEEPIPGSSKSASVLTSSTLESSPSDEIIQFSNYTNRLYESNIWSLFPELKTVTINIIAKTKGEHKLGLDYDRSKAKRKVYTREGYRKFCEGQRMIAEWLLSFAGFE